MGQRGLLNRQKRSNLVSAWTYDPDRSSDEKKQEVACERKDETGADHKNGTDDEHSPAATAVSLGG
jgi:hypothetical protein